MLMTNGPQNATESLSLAGRPERVVYLRPAAVPGTEILAAIERACALLRTGMPPSVVASVVGFADQSHLTRHFRRVMRVTPACYVRATVTSMRRSV
jgi:hypothetical protein